MIVYGENLSKNPAHQRDFLINCIASLDHE